MMKRLLVVALLTPLVGVAEEYPSFDQVIEKLDGQGRRMCHEIMKSTSYISLPSGQYTVDPDGDGPISSVVAHCDAISGKTRLISFSEGFAASELFRNDRQLESIFESKDYLELVGDEDAVYHYIKDSVTGQGEAILNLPVLTSEVVINGLKLGSVEVVGLGEDGFFSIEKKRMWLGNNLHLKIDEEVPSHLLVKFKEGLFSAESIWVR